MTGRAQPYCSQPIDSLTGECSVVFGLARAVRETVSITRINPSFYPPAASMALLNWLGRDDTGGANVVLSDHLEVSLHVVMINLLHSQASHGAMACVSFQSKTHRGNSADPGLPTSAPLSVSQHRTN